MDVLKFFSKVVSICAVLSFFMCNKNLAFASKKEPFKYRVLVSTKNENGRWEETTKYITREEKDSERRSWYHVNNVEKKPIKESDILSTFNYFPEIDDVTLWNQEGNCAAEAKMKINGNYKIKNLKKRDRRKSYTYKYRCEKVEKRDGELERWVIKELNGSLVYTISRTDERNIIVKDTAEEGVYKLRVSRGPVPSKEFTKMAVFCAVEKSFVSK